MLFITKSLTLMVFITAFNEVVGEHPSFRVLAPEFVCPNDDQALIEKPDNTVITIKTDVTDLRFSWLVRWRHLDGPSQRFTLLLWKTVRDLEGMLNAPQPEPLVYVIENAKLLQGVEYLFNVTASPPNSENSTTKMFGIDNIKGNTQLLIEGRSEKLSVILIGPEITYADMEYVTEAEVVTCSPTQDYYFAWSVESESGSALNVSETSGSELKIPPYSLLAGVGYYVSCTVYRNNGVFLTQTSLPFQVLYRGLTVNLNMDVMVVTANNAFDLIAVVHNHDYYWDVIKFEWSCVHKSEPCEKFGSNKEEILQINGLPYLGRYEITVVVTVQDQLSSANATIYVVQPSLPVIQIVPQHRIVNEYSVVVLTANVSNVTPSCTLAWYFLSSLEYNDTCYDTDECQVGEALSESLTISSLEENFLNEITDFTNDTEWRQVVVEMIASTGRARFVAQCGCSLTFSCDTQGIVHGDVYFKLNESPKVAEIKVSPETGTAMETIFRVSTLAALDSDKPLRYSFFCRLNNNDTLMLASNFDHLSVETFLPYNDAIGTSLWVEVCDSRDACASSEVKIVKLLEGEGRTLQALVDRIRGHMTRCEMMPLRRVVQSAVTTYMNADQMEVLTTFTKTLLEILLTAGKHHCIKTKQDYYNFLDWLTLAGIDTSYLIE